MRLTTVTNVSVDGVMQGLGGPEEDTRGDFERGGWAMPLFDEEVAELLGAIYQRADAFLLGRRTYEVFAGSWGTDPDMAATPIGRALNDRPKYVVSTTLGEPSWSATTVVRGDLERVVRELRATSTGEVQVHGSLRLVRWLLDHELVDEITLLTYPVVVGQGERLFPDAGRDTALELLDHRAVTNGVTVRTYRPAGRARYAQ